MKRKKSSTLDLPNANLVEPKDYRVMWLLVLFDLPTQLRSEQKKAAVFRKKLLHHGFTMMQYSVYKRYIVGHRETKVYIRKVRSWIPSGGSVDLLPITDQAHANMMRFAGGNIYPTEVGRKQLTLF